MTAPTVSIKPEISDGRQRLIGRIRRAPLDYALAACAALIALLWLLLVIVHVDDRYRVLADFPWEESRTGATSGVMMALAQAAAEGQLYPPVEAGGAIAGTRYAPLPIVLYAGLSLLTGELLISGKVLAALTVLALIALLYAGLRRLGTPIPFAAALAASTLLALSVRHIGLSPMTADGLATALQLGAVLVLLRSRGQTARRVLTVAGLLCALAITAKVSALWAPAAIALWLLGQRRVKAALEFVGATIGATVLLGGIFALLSGGRMIENLHATLFIATAPGAVEKAPLRLLELLTAQAPLTWLLVPFAALAVVRIVQARRWSLPALSLLMAVGLTVVVLSDNGAQGNHLIDLVVLVVLVVGELWGSSPTSAPASAPAPGRLPAIAAVLGLALIWGAGTALTEPGLRGETKAALAEALGRGADPRYDPWPLEGVVRPTDRVLSVDPYVAVRQGRRPAVFDPWMHVNVGQAHPEVLDSLAARVGAGEFDRLVIPWPLPQAREFFASVAFGEPVHEAACRHYALLGEYGGYYVYAPSAAGTAC